MNTGLVIGMAGSGGDGVVSAGDSLMTALAMAGYHAMLTKSFGPQIRGGESSFRLRVSTGPVLGPGGALDVAVALNWDDFLKFGAELQVDGHSVVIYDSNTRVAPDQIPLAGVKPAEVVPVAIEAMAKETAGSEKAKNTVVLGLMAGWFSLAPPAHPRRPPEALRQEGRGHHGAQRARLRSGPRLGAGQPSADRPHPRAGGGGYDGQDGGRRQRSVRRRSDLRRVSVLRRLSHHPLVRGHAVPEPRDLEVRRNDAAVRGRDRRHRRVRGRELRGQEGADRDERPRHVAQDRDDRPGDNQRVAARDPQRAAGRPLHRHPDQERAVGPVPGGLLGARRRAAPGPVADGRRRHVPGDGGGVQHRRALPDARHHPVGAGNRPAQGGDRPAGHQGRRRRGTPEAEPARTRALRPVPPDRFWREPDQPSRDAGRQLPGVGHRAHREWRPDGDRVDPREDEREAACAS